MWDLFDRAFKVDELERWTEDISDDNRKILSTANRMFTPLRDTDRRDVHVPFDRDIDPDGGLERIARNGFKRTADNIVEYAQEKTLIDGSKKYKKVKPQTFRIGDLVAVQLSFIVAPLRGGRYKMVVVLRSITLLDDTFTQRLKLTSTMPKKQYVPIKRKLRSFEDDEEQEGGNDDKQAASYEEFKQKVIARQRSIMEVD
ncbi:hypothetical protein C0995_015577 [Termitomyces sp. Mi166|nr:hypothetical protein C0995_015577 [Termitomyces sp. Mi166\